MMSRPRAVPLTNCVLPAPRSPDKAMTSPRFAARPQLWPSDSVSAGLFVKMLVAMSGQRAGAGFIAKGDAFAGGDFADAGERNVRELLLPRIEHGNCIFTRNGEKQLKILAVGECGKQGSFGCGFSARSKFGGSADGKGRGE